TPPGRIPMSPGSILSPPRNPGSARCPEPCQRPRLRAMAARMRNFLLALALGWSLPHPLRAAEPPDVATLVARVKAALEPPKASIRQLNLAISGETGGTTQGTAGPARQGGWERG